MTSIPTAPQGPSCRQPISSSKLFTLEAFNSAKKGKREASGRPFDFATDTMDVDESESDSDCDFVVPDDEEGYEPHRRKKKHAKRNVVLSDDDEYNDVIIPAVKPETKPKASAAEMNENEISTKMQVCTCLVCAVISGAHPVLEHDGRAHRVEEVPPRSEG